MIPWERVQNHNDGFCNFLVEMERNLVDWPNEGGDGNS